MATKSVRVKVGDRWYTAEIEDLSSSPVKVDVEGDTFYVEMEGLPPRSSSSPGATPTCLSAPGPPQHQTSQTALPLSDKIIRSPMSGKIVGVSVRPGDTVTPGQEVCVVEAMKMEQSIRTSQGGLVKAVHVRPMDQIGTDDPIMELE